VVPIADHDVREMAAPAVPTRPFSIVDEVNCHHDSADEPCNVQLEAWLPGHLDGERLRAAVRVTLAGQPRARARRAAGGWWRRGYTWEFPAAAALDPVSVTTWRTAADLDTARTRFLATAPPLESSPPFRLLLARGPEWDSLLLNAHHAAFDGRSCLRLLRLIAKEYAEPAPVFRTAAPRAPVPCTRFLQTPAPPAPVSPPASPAAVSPPAPISTASHNLRRRRRRRPRRRVARIAPQHADGRAPGYGFALASWPGVPNRADSVTVNDVLIAALIQAIGSWNAAHGRRPARVRVTMPVDTRPPGGNDETGELGNLSRLCVVSADPEQDSPASANTASDRVLSAVAAQTSRAKRTPGPPVSPFIAAFIRAPAPVGVKRRLTRLAVRGAGRLVCDTSLLSNLGNVTDPPRFGPLTAERLWFSTTAHMPRGLSVGAVTVGGQLHLCFRYRYSLFDDVAGREFAAVYAAALDGREGR
jgi:NRPS condensation-like uncharacterized protein